MRVLVISRRHHLHPVAWRLKREGADVEIAVVKKRYTKAWEGRLTPSPLKANPKDRESVRVVNELVGEQGVVLLTDDAAWSREVEGPRFGRLGEDEPWPTPGIKVTVGGWFDGEGFQLPHLWLVRVGAWIGDQGPREAAAGLLLQPAPAPFLEVLQGQADALKSAGFRGLGFVEVRGQPDGGYTSGRAEWGWPPLHTFAFLAELSSLSDLLRGGGAELRAPAVAVITVSVPPWPLRVNQSSREQPIPDPGPAVRRATFFHDVKVVDGKLFVGGMDGLIGVVHGSGCQPETAAMRALMAAGGIQVEERQLRTDAFAQVRQLLIGLEVAGAYASSL